MWVKVCGNTNPADAVQAAELGADALGFIFAGSPRQVSAVEVAAITAELPEAVERVGVFDSHVAEEITRTAQEAGLSAIQLHGGFNAELLERLAGTQDVRIAITQALHWPVCAAGDRPDALRQTLVGQLRSIAALSKRVGRVIRVLIDSNAGSALGGTGVVFDWEAAAETFAVAAALGLPAIVAGGLRPENVGEAIARVRPWGVDVASGVEVSPGRKDPTRVAEFLTKARG